VAVQLRSKRAGATWRRCSRLAAAVTMAVAVAVSGCGRDASPTAPTTVAPPEPQSSSLTSFALSGTVIHRITGAPLPGVRVEIVEGISLGRHAATNQQGHYSMDGLPAGAYVVRATADGFESVSTPVSIATDRRLDLALAPPGAAPAPPTAQAEVGGTVTDADTHAPLVDVDVEIVDGANRGRETRTDAAGRYALAALEPGDAVLRIKRSGYVTRTVEVLVGATSAVDVSLTREAGAPPIPHGVELSGRAVDVLSDRPLPGIVVSVEGAQATTDATGTFSVTAGSPADVLPVTLSSPMTVERRTLLRGHAEASTLTLIPSSLDLRSFDEMLRSRGALHRWVAAPRLVVQRRVLAFTNTTATSYTATADVMSEAEAQALVADLRWALPQLTGEAFADFAAVEIETAAEGEAVSITRGGAIVVARYRGLQGVVNAWGYGRWAWNGAGEVLVGSVMLDLDFEQSNSPHRRSLRAHELGHALGYDHVSASTSVMHIAARVEPTAFDRDATKIAFRRAPLNRSPDVDADPAAASRLRSSGLTWSGRQ
jgi:hypothetical protein